MQSIIALVRALLRGICHLCPTLASSSMIMQIMTMKISALRKCRFTKEEEMGGHIIAWWPHGRKVQHE